MHEKVSNVFFIMFSLPYKTSVISLSGWAANSDYIDHKLQHQIFIIYYCQIKENNNISMKIGLRLPQTGEHNATKENIIHLSKKG